VSAGRQPVLGRRRSQVCSFPGSSRYHWPDIQTIPVVWLNHCVSNYYFNLEALVGHDESELTMHDANDWPASCIRVNLWQNQTALLLRSYFKYLTVRIYRRHRILPQSAAAHQLCALIERLLSSQSINSQSALCYILSEEVEVRIFPGT
jgi:hypothetical protein